ncbi:MAG TPA: glucodextranase DOMON-like domain-containing protein [Anaerolineaceae bacterium]|nr:glucodextranase DOMON-like domain-containing protein [Anaerolineaceae bacterium]HPN50644.1 glucodextranase DOMON-like domain-containing protein [Anaerolineaceae bacterium]
MKKFQVILSVLVMLSMVMAACTNPTPTPSPSPVPPTQAATSAPKPTDAAPAPTAVPADDGEVLYLNLVWHQHQPLYYKNDDGVYTRPWVRVHATKDYYDMASTVQKYPDVHVTFNLTPVLLMQINDFVKNGAKDVYWTLSEVPASQLTNEDKDFILRRFFDANWDHIIRTHPGYKALLDKRAGTTDEQIAAAMASFTEQDFRDLQIWFNLAWMDPDFLAAEPLKSLVQKDHGYSEEDKVTLFNEVKRIMGEIVPLHKQMQDAGQIEVITTPYAHPILPLIYNTDLAKVGNASAELPDQPFSYPQDAEAQLKKSVEIYTENFGRAPRGLWPGEGSVAREIVPLVTNAGYKWMASGEQVLYKTLGIPSFTRDTKDTVFQADQLYRPYLVTPRPDAPVQGGPVYMVFRDLLISDKIGFTYSGTPGAEAAKDLMQRLENIRARLKASNATGPHLVSIILDGENAWENYDNDGKEFLNALYKELSESKTVKTITPSEYFEKFPEQKELNGLFPGAWFSPNYDTWIGETEEKLAWNYLGEVRANLAKYESGEKKAPSEEALKTAFDFMYLAEGSDWFWWYGADQDSGNDSYFDEGYRALLAKVYESLGETVPAFVKIPLVPEKVVAAQQDFSAMFTPTIDGAEGTDEWKNAAYYPFVGGAQARSEDVTAGFYYGLDSQNLYLRVDAKEDWKTVSKGTVSVYISSPRLNGNSAVSLRTQGTDDPYVLGFGATVMVEADLAASSAKVYTVDGSVWKDAGISGVKVAVSGKVMELSLPISALGAVQAGDTLSMVAVTGADGRDIQSLPVGGPAQIVLPELTPINFVVEITDPEGDDHGPGTYTYPTDAVFGPSIFDLTSFKVGEDENDIIFRFSIKGKILNSWSSPNNLSVQSLDVYIDKDPGKGTGSRLLLPGRNAALQEGYGWDYALWAEGWTPGIYKGDANAIEPSPVDGATMKILVDSVNGNVTLRVPKATFGDGNIADWAFLAVMMGQEGYPAAGVWRVRDVATDAAQWRFGGAGADSNHTRIIDIAWPAESTPTQEEMLSGFTPQSKPVGELTVADFAQLKMYGPSR